MRRLLLAASLCLFVLPLLFSQGVIISATASDVPDPSAMLHVKSAAKGFLTPQMLSTAPPEMPANGLLVFFTDKNQFYYNSGTQFAPLWAPIPNGYTGDIADDNAFFGYNSGASANAANSNTGFGYKTLSAVGANANNTAFGSSALSATSSFSNTAVGSKALASNISGSDNTAVGKSALNGNSAGAGNTAVGSNAGGGNTFSQNVSNTFLGFGADVAGGSVISIANSTAVGANAKISTPNTIVLGDNQIVSLQCHTTTITALSDRRLKTNIRDARLGLSFIKLLHPVDYNYIQRGQENILQTGFIAQEVEAAAAESGAPDYHAVDKTNLPSGGFYGLRYAELVTPLVKAVKELDAKNQNLQKENERLQKELSDLKGLVSGISDKMNQLEAKADNSNQKKTLTQK